MLQKYFFLDPADSILVVIYIFLQSFLQFLSQVNLTTHYSELSSPYLMVASLFTQLVLFPFVSSDYYLFHFICNVIISMYPISNLFLTEIFFFLSMTTLAVFYHLLIEFPSLLFFLLLVLVIKLSKLSIIQVFLILFSLFIIIQFRLFEFHLFFIQAYLIPQLIILVSLLLLVKLEIYFKCIIY